MCQTGTQDFIGRPETAPRHAGEDKGRSGHSYQVITGDETWVFRYNPKTKRQSLQWKTEESPRPKKTSMSKSKIKVMLIAFCDQKDLVHQELVPKNETVNQYLFQPLLI